jgi:hypothetical protein
VAPQLVERSSFRSAVCPRAHEPAARVVEELGLSLNSVLLAKTRVLKRLRQESAGLVE